MKRVLSLYGLSASLFLTASVAVAGVSDRVFRPVEFIWIDFGSNGPWKSFEEFQAWYNGRSDRLFAECMARPKTYGYPWQCGKNTITGSDPAKPGDPFDIYYNGQPYWNITRVTDYLTGTNAEGMQPVWETTSYRSRDVGGTTPVVVANPKCPGVMDRNDLLVSGSGPTKRWEVTCVDRLDAQKPRFAVGSPLNKALACPIGNPIEPSTGEKVKDAVDYSAEAGRLAVARHYRSRFGQWASPIPALLDFTPPRPAGFPVRKRTFWVSWASGSSLTFPLLFDEVPSTTGWELHLLRPDGSRIIFTGDAAGYTSLTPGVALRKVMGSDGAEYWHFDAGDRNATEVYRASDGKLMQIAYADGYSLLYDYLQASAIGVTSRTSGRTVSYGYGAAGSLTHVTLPGNARIEFQGEYAQHESVRFPDGAEHHYLYDEPSGVGATQSSRGLLTGEVDERGARHATYKFDDSGYGRSTELSGGVSKFSVNRYSTFISITEPLGGTRSLYWYAAASGARLLQSASQPAGSGCAASTRSLSFDTAGDVVSANDFDGNRTCYATASVRSLEITRVDGLPGSAACNAYLPGASTLPAGSRKTSTQWHPEWRLQTKVAEPGRITTNVYNGQPDPFNGGAIASCAPSTALLPDGKPIAVLCKQVEQATTDADGHLGFSAALQPGVAARVQQRTYNEYGQVLSATDPRGNTSTYTYYSDTTADHTRGDLQQVVDAAGLVTQYPRYNPHGQVLQVVDPNGVITDYTYDLRQRLTGVSSLGQSTVYEYWPTGLLKKLTLPDGSYVRYDYDDAHRLTDVSDGQGNSVHYTLDNAGNRTKEETKDASGALARQMSRSMDALSRVQQTTGRE